MDFEKLSESIRTHIIVEWKNVHRVACRRTLTRPRAFSLSRLGAMKYFNKWVVFPLACYAKSRILGTFDTNEFDMRIPLCCRILHHPVKPARPWTSYGEGNHYRCSFVKKFHKLTLRLKINNPTSFCFPRKTSVVSEERVNIRYCMFHLLLTGTCHGTELITVIELVALPAQSLPSS